MLLCGMQQPFELVLVINALWNLKEGATGRIQLSQTPACFGGLAWLSLHRKLEAGDSLRM